MISDGYHVGDCRELLRQLPRESVQTVVTSPPYWGLRDYGTGTWEGGDAECSHQHVNADRAHSMGDRGERGAQASAQARATPMRSSCSHCGAVRIDSQIGLEATPDEYVASIVDVFREVRGALRDDGTLWVNLGDTYAGRGRGSDTGSTLEGSRANQRESRRALIVRGSSARQPPPNLKSKDMIGIPWMVAFALRNDGWYLRMDVIWHKPNPMPEAITDRPTKAHEYVFLLSKSATYHYDADAIKEPVSIRCYPRPSDSPISVFPMPPRQAPFGRSVSTQRDKPISPKPPRHAMPSPVHPLSHRRDKPVLFCPAQRD